MLLLTLDLINIIYINNTTKDVG